LLNFRPTSSKATSAGPTRNTERAVASKLLRATPGSMEDAVNSKSGAESPLFLVALLGSIAAYAVLVATLVGVCKL